MWGKIITDGKIMTGGKIITDGTGVFFCVIWLIVLARFAVFMFSFVYLFMIFIVAGEEIFLKEHSTYRSKNKELSEEDKRGFSVKCTWVSNYTRLGSGLYMTLLFCDFLPILFGWYISHIFTHEDFFSVYLPSSGFCPLFVFLLYEMLFTYIIRLHVFTVLWRLYTL